MANLETIVISICIFGSAVLAIFIIAKYNYLIRKIAIEKGVEAGRNKVNYLETGCIVLGIGAGLGASSVFTILNLNDDTMELLIYATILIGGALGLLAAHFIRNKVERR